MQYIVSCTFRTIQSLAFMKLRYFSDLHIDHALAQMKHASRATLAMIWSPAPQPDDARTTLVLAGDIWHGTAPLSFAGLSWMKSLSEQFKSVVVVLGNHDYYKENIDRLPSKWRKMLLDLGIENVHLLEISEGVEAGVAVIEGVRFIGGTLWTSMDQGNPDVQAFFNHEKLEYRFRFNDRNYIRAGINNERFSSKHWLKKHSDSVRYMKVALEDDSLPTILVTHHPLIHQANPARYQESDLTKYLYGNTLDAMILDHPHVIGAIHGHTHAGCCLDAGSAWVRSNPHGYPQEIFENKPDNEEILIDLNKTVIPRLRRAL